MPCYHPNYVTYNHGEFGRFAGRLRPEVLEHPLPDQEIVMVPCGVCSGCRLDRGKAWSDRMLLEFATPRDGVARRALFLTMTYDDDHVPIITGTDGVPYRSLDKIHPRLFWKRLRYYYPDKLCRYYLAAEYGDHTFRPHYHAILFNFSLDDFPDSFVFSTKDDNPLYESPRLNKIWSFGSVRFSVANYATFTYVARYVLKKQFVSDLGSLFYRGRCPPFNCQSLKPGLGADFFKDPEFSRVSVSDGVNVHSVALPRCVLDKISLTDPELYDIIKTNRRYLAAEHLKLQQMQIDKPYFDYLKDEEASLHNRKREAFKRSDF